MAKTKPYQVPESIWKAAEARARRRRKVSGEDIRWTDVIREALTRSLIKK